MIRLAGVAIRKVIIANPEWGLMLVLSVHDEYVLEVFDEYIDVASVAVKKAMEEAVDLGVPVLADISVGKRYSECA